MRISLALITAFTFFAMYSCSPAKKDTGQTKQAPFTNNSIEQTGSSTTEPAQPVDSKTDEQTLETGNNAEVMLNPPHGQPYHRCDIPVGAPLNSPPASTARETLNNQVQVAAPNSANSPTAPTVENARRLNPSQAQNTATATKEGKPRLNPAHGQPYHRCDIPVGSPLP